MRSAKKVVPALLSLISPQSVVDVGCGVGTWLSVFRGSGINDVLGVDGSYVRTDALLIPHECFLPRDLTSPIGVGRRFDLAISLEVGEHLPTGSSGSFVDQLVGLSDVVLFSAAVPGQGGVHHVNEQWQGYWLALFEARGYVSVDCMRNRLWQDPDVQPYYKQNMILYVERETLGRRTDLGALAEQGAVLPADLVHPDVFEYALNQPPNLRRIVAALPGAIRQSVMWRLRPR
jgi:hypothetical protein